jgi:hypothetical protein
MNRDIWGCREEGHFEKASGVCPLPAWRSFHVEL